MQKIFMVYKQSDTTEGRGPMVFHTAFTTEEVANAYIDDRPGVMGRTAKWSKEKYGDWKVIPAHLNETLDEAKAGFLAEERERALKKLSQRERDILGL